MDITLEKVDAVRERTGATYEEAKAALEAENGSEVDAIIRLEKEENAGSKELLEKIKAAVRKGNVTKVRMKKDGRDVLTVPVSAGVGVGLLGLVAAPWAVIAAAIAAYGLDCKFELIKEDGTIDELGGSEESDTYSEE